MSSKIILLLFFVVSCGVKGDPTTPKSPAFQSFMENYPDIKTDKPLDETNGIRKSKSR